MLAEVFGDTNPSPFSDQRESSSKHKDDIEMENYQETQNPKG